MGTGEKSRHKRGGIDWKTNAALLAMNLGWRCEACVVLSGDNLVSIWSVAGSEYNGPPLKGTLFAIPISELEK